MKPCVIAIVGPTASGKSTLAIQIAKKLGGEIISADSRQVYNGLDIGSGKVTRAERRAAPHHLLDVANPNSTYTVANFLRDGKRALRGIQQHGHLPIVVGGTGFWIDALLQGLQLPSVAPNPALRKRLAALPTSQLFTQLQKLDPRRATTIDAHNPVRLIRALEIAMTTGKPVPRVATQQTYNVIWLGLRPSEKILRKNIYTRLHARLRRGMIAEVRRILARGVPPQRLIDLGLEYRFVTLYLQKKLTRKALETQLETAIWHYAKRQITWFKRNHAIHWVQNSTDALRLCKKWLQRNPEFVR